jgi:hypothetical protein
MLRCRWADDGCVELRKSGIRAETGECPQVIRPLHCLDILGSNHMPIPKPWNWRAIDPELVVEAESAILGIGRRVWANPCAQQAATGADGLSKRESKRRYCLVREACFWRILFDFVIVLLRVPIFCRSQCGKTTLRAGSNGLEARRTHAQIAHHSDPEPTVQLENGLFLLEKAHILTRCIGM